MTSKQPAHTPGPWAITRNVSTLSIVPQSAEMPDIKPTLATISKWPREAVNESEANARLMAAAPELLEALIDLLYQAKLSEQEGGWDFQQAINAIAKAIN